MIALTRMAEPNMAMGGTGLEPLAPTYDIARHSAPRDDKSAAYAAFFTSTGRVLAPHGASCRKPLGGASWSKRGPGSAR